MGILQKFLVGMILFSALITGFYVFMGDLSGEEGYNIDTTNDTVYQLAYNKTENLSRDIQDSYDRVATMETNVAAQFFTGLVEIVDIVKDIIVMPYTILVGDGGIINTMGGTKEDGGLGMPTWITGMLIAIVVIALIFGVIAVIIKYKA